MLLNLNNRILYPTRLDASPAQVWTKPSWSAPFTLRPDLIPVQSTWAAAPDVSTAALEYRYGLVYPPGNSVPVILDRITARGYWVLIRWQADDGSPIDWLGYAETPVTRDHTPARHGMPDTGRQTILCTGLLRALQHHYIDTTVYVDLADENKAARSGGTGTTFNAGDRGNRSANKLQLAGEGPEAHVFALPRDLEATWWSTRDIVEHLIAFHLPTPTSIAEDGGVPWSIPDLSALPTWDRPVIDTDLVDVASILDELLQPSRLLGYAVGCSVTGSAPPTVTSITINPFTTLAAPLYLPAGVLPANPVRLEIAAQYDPLTQITADADASGVVDQVIVQGPREIGIGTFAASGENAAWEKGWSPDDEAAYATGASDADDWDAIDQDEKRLRNEQLRTRGKGLHKLADVFSLFTMRKDWNWSADGNSILMPQDGQPYRPCPLSVEFLADELPLYIGVDYSGDPAAVDESGGTDRMPPAWFYTLPGAPDTLLPMFRRSHETAKSVREIPFRDFTVTPTFEDGPAVRLRVSGAPQHAIAGKDFEGNDADVDQFTVFGDYPPDTWRVVIGVRGDRRPRYAIPSASAVAGLDVVRRKVITFDDHALTAVHIAKDTVLGFKADGTPIKSDGGLLRNPEPILRSLCQLFYRQLGQPRYTASITTGRRLSGLRVGAMLASIDTERHAINAPITSMSITAPLAEDGSPAARATQTAHAAAYQGDVLQLLRGQQPRSGRWQPPAKKGRKR